MSTMASAETPAAGAVVLTCARCGHRVRFCDACGASAGSCTTHEIATSIYCARCGDRLRHEDDTTDKCWMCNGLGFVLRSGRPTDCRGCSGTGRVPVESPDDSQNTMQKTKGSKP